MDQHINHHINGTDFFGGGVRMLLWVRMKRGTNNTCSQKTARLSLWRLEPPFVPVPDEVLTETECGAAPHLSAAGQSNLWSAGHVKAQAQIQSDVSLIKEAAGLEVDSTPSG